MRASINGMSERLRLLLAEPGYVELPGCYDVLSAMVLEEVGFRCLFLSGYGVAASLLGNPDIGLTTLTETSAMARQVVGRVDVPVIVDADNGYGNEDNVVRTVRELEYAGAAAIVIEDQVLPKRCGHSAKKEILPFPVYMRKLEAALHARQSPLCIVARTDATDIDEGIQRAKAFHAAGADVLLIDGLRSLDHVKRIGQEVPGCKQVNIIHGGATPILPAAQFHELGMKIVQYSTPALYVAQQALRTQMQKLSETHDLNTIADASVTFQQFQNFIEDRYAKGAQPVSAAGGRGE